MKKALIKTVCDIMSKNQNVYMFTADLGYGVMNPIMERYPDKFVNMGICEQNMASVAAGMALEGNVVFMYSIGNFPTLRCLEQIRNDICYHHANVKIVAVGGGFAYGNLGMSHHATEDLAVMRALPGMTVFAPADANEVTYAVREAMATEGPVYIRLGRGGEPSLNNNIKDINKIQLLKTNEDLDVKNYLAILSIGTVAQECLNAAEYLGDIASVSVYSVPKLKPLDEDGISEVCVRNQYIVTVEEHNIIGGLGSAVAEVIAENERNTKLIRIGMQDQFTQVVGSPSYLRHYYGLDSKGIAAKIANIIGGHESE